MIIKSILLMILLFIVYILTLTFLASLSDNELWLMLSLFLATIPILFLYLLITPYYFKDYIKAFWEIEESKEN